MRNAELDSWERMAFILNTISTKLLQASKLNFNTISVWNTYKIERVKTPQTQYQMYQRIAHITLVVKEYDEAIDFYVNKLDFKLL